jgi:hypothetical protein
MPVSRESPFTVYTIIENVLAGADHPQALRDKSNLYRCLPRVLTVSVEIQLALRVDHDEAGLKVFDLLKPQMFAEKDRRHPAQQFELVHLADYADVQSPSSSVACGVTFIPPP